MTFDRLAGSTTVIRNAGTHRGLDRLAQATALAGCLVSSACAGAVVKSSRTTPTPATEALLVLPGFGYNGAGEQALRRLAEPLASEGFDLFVSDYISRGGLAASRGKLQQFVSRHHLERYERLHVFAFIAGAWTVNPLITSGSLPNLATVIYDRSPYQERAPRIADDSMHTLALLRYGSPVFDLARTPYPPLNTPAVKVGLVVETRPTPFIRKHEAEARAYGPFDFACGSFSQRHDDCVFVALNHEELYLRIGEVWPELRSFIRNGRFSPAADRTPPAADALANAAGPRDERNR